MPSLDFPPRLLPAPQAAHYLGISESTLRQLGLPRVSIGSKRLYDRLDLDAFADTLSEAQTNKSVVDECDEAFGVAR